MMRSINPKSLGIKSKFAILQKFNLKYDLPLEDERDLVEWAKSIGIKSKFRRFDKVAIDVWEKSAIHYNNLLQEDREKEERRKRRQNQKDEKLIKNVLDWLKNPNGSEKRFTLPRDEVMVKLLKGIRLNARFGRKVMMSIGSVSYPLNMAFIAKMITAILDGAWLTEEANSLSSDEQAVFDLINATSFTLKIIDEGLAKTKKKGAFFKYTHNIVGLDLLPYQIKDGIVGAEFEDSCFIDALKLFYKNLEIDAEEKIARVKSKMITRTITSHALETIAKELEVSISIRDSRDVKGKNTSRVDVKNKGCEITIPLGLVDEHYFLIEVVPITKYALINHKDLVGVERWGDVYRSGNKRTKDRYMDSYEVIDYLFNNKDTYLNLLSPNELMATIHYDIAMDIDVYNVDIDKDTRKVEYVERNSKEEVICYFDFESTTDRGDDEKNPLAHQAYLVCFKTDEMVKPICVRGKLCGKRMLEYVSRLHGFANIRFIAHNVKYDFQFLYKYLYQVKKIQRGSMLLSANAEFYVDGNKCKFTFVDSYSFIATKLSKFPKMFGMKAEKEIMPYGLWNSKTIARGFIPIEETRSYCDKQVISMNIGRKVSDDEKLSYFNSFIEKAKSWDCIECGEVDLYKYSENYCNIDVLLLEGGYSKFRCWIKAVCELDINEYITLPSIADGYMKKSGVYDNCYEISGSQLLFIQKTMVGGRTMMSENKKYKLDVELDDLDAVSLYPSAMSRMGGYLQGTPKVLVDKTYGFLQKCDGYYVEVVIDEVAIHRKFPLMSCITEDGIRLWTNDMVGKTMYMDRFSLEDLIQFHGIKFHIIKGYYYDEGRNNKIGETINYLFNTRLEKKKEKNAIEQIYKLLMNSAYGRTLLKPFVDEKVYKSEKNYEAHIVRHYESVKCVQKLHDNSFEITQLKSIIEHYNLAHIGCEVLSMSKRIMNELMCLAEDIGVEIYYQDTDSTHTPVCDIPRLSKAYLEKYGREMEGNNMGQFNCDFDSGVLKGKIKSVSSVFLGKKCYVDRLEGDEKGVYEYHIRMKGVSADAIADKCLELDIDVLELYTRLYNGESFDFDLACRGVKASFETMDNGLMCSRDAFVRNIKF